jgi:prolyl-tRNA synthetase
VIKGEKKERELFPGAEITYSIEAMMQDRKALQAGTSHFLGQNFARASEIMFLDQSGTRQHAWTTSWGVSTRLIGGLIMTHSDDDGLILPPRVAPAQVVIIPIFRTDDEKPRVLEYCNRVAQELRAQRYEDRPVSVIVDERDERGGEKVWQWIKQGVPVRLEIGPRDMEKDSVFVGRREKPHKEKQSIARSEFVANIAATLQSIQDELFSRAQTYREQNTHRIDSKEEFYRFFSSPPAEENAPTPIHGGFALTHFSGDVELERQIKDDLSVTVRCMPLEKSESGTCPFTGKPSAQRVIWAKAY